jgi:hypothetical protein
MDANIRTLAGLTQAEVTALAGQDFVTHADISMLEMEDLTQVIPGASLGKRRKLTTIGKYLARGQVINAATSLQLMTTFLQAPAAAAAPAGGGFYPPDPTRGSLKLHVNQLPEFEGSPLDWEVWELKIRVTIGQTGFRTLLAAPPTVGNLIEENRNKEFYNLLMNAILGGSAMHVMKPFQATEDGHAAWHALTLWYGSHGTSRSIIDHYRNRLESLRLTETTEASSYINNFIICCQKLEDRGEGYTVETKRQRFLDQIEDDFYDVAKQQLGGDTTIDFAGCVSRIRLREQDVVKTENETTKRARRTIAGGEGSSEPKKDSQIPFIPVYILSKVKPDNVRSDLLKWRSTYNSEGRSIRADELSIPSTSNEGAKGDDKSKSTRVEGSSNGPSKRNRNSRNRKSGTSNSPKARRVTAVSRGRRTTTAASGVPEATTANLGSVIQISMKDNDDSGDSESGDDEDDDNSKSESIEPPKKKAKNGKAKRKRRQKSTLKGRRNRNPVSRRGRTELEKPRGIIDPGTEIDVIGGVGWLVLSAIDNTCAQLEGALAGMGGRSLPLVRAVTAYDHPALGPILLGVGCAGYDDRAEQTESLFNSHDLRKNGVVVHDTTKRDGGEQRLEVDGIHVNLDFVDDKTLSFKLRRPTTREHDELTIHWLSPRRLDMKSDSNWIAMRRSPAAIVPSPAPWEERLGNSPEMITAKTLLATTQLCEAPVEMDKREAPRQHRKQRVQALHPKRIEG